MRKFYDVVVLVDEKDPDFDHVSLDLANALEKLYPVNEGAKIPQKYRGFLTEAEAKWLRGWIDASPYSIAYTIRINSREV